MSESFELIYTVHDTQFHGVPAVKNLCSCIPDILTYVWELFLQNIQWHPEFNLHEVVSIFTPRCFQREIKKLKISCLEIYLSVLGKEGGGCSGLQIKVLLSGKFKGFIRWTGLLGE